MEREFAMLRRLRPVVASLCAIISVRGESQEPEPTVVSHEYYEKESQLEKCTVRVDVLLDSCRVVVFEKMRVNLAKSLAHWQGTLQCGESIYRCGRKFLCGCAPKDGGGK